MKQTQGDKLAEMCKRKPRTMMELLASGVSTCPWKRLSEWERLHRKDWTVVRAKRYMGDGEYLTTWAVKRA